MQFMRPGDDSSVHFRVEVEAKDEQEEETSADAWESDESEAESVAVNFNASCVVPRIVGLMRTLESKRMNFSNSTDTQTRRMFVGLKKTKYELPAATLLDDVMQGIRENYTRHLRTMAKPWDENEDTKRVFIQSVVEHCVDAVNLLHPDTPKLGLELELDIKSFNLNASGKADFVITKQDRMMIIIEAKKCDIEKGKHQTLAMMEALRYINKTVNRKWSSIKAICTDFQSWLFIERDSTTLRSNNMGVGYNSKKENVFPEEIIPIYEILYAMLLDL